MQVPFKACPDWLKVGEIGDSIVEADDSFRRQFSILVLAATRDGKIPLRNKNGFKPPLESLAITERGTHQFAKRLVEERLLASIGDFDADVQRTRQLAADAPWMVWGKGRQIVDIDTDYKPTPSRRSSTLSMRPEESLIACLTTGTGTPQFWFPK